MDKLGHCFSLGKWNGPEKWQVCVALLTRAVGTSIQHLLNAMLFLCFSGERMRAITIVARGRRRPVVLLPPQVGGEQFPVVPKDNLKEKGCSRKRQTGHLLIR